MKLYCTKKLLYLLFFVCLFLFCYLLFTFIFHPNFFFFLKKKTQNCRDGLNYYNTDIYPLRPPYGELFFTKFSTNFFYHIFICVHLFLSVRISSYLWLWKSFLIHDHLWESLLIYDHQWESLLFCDNLFEPFLSAKISSYLLSSVRIF